MTDCQHVIARLQNNWLQLTQKQMSKPEVRNEPLQPGVVCVGLLRNTKLAWNCHEKVK